MIVRDKSLRSFSCYMATLVSDLKLIAAKLGAQTEQSGR